MTNELTLAVVGLTAVVLAFGVYLPLALRLRRLTDLIRRIAAAHLGSGVDFDEIGAGGEADKSEGASEDLEAARRQIASCFAASPAAAQFAAFCDHWQSDSHTAFDEVLREQPLLPHGRSQRLLDLSPTILLGSTVSAVAIDFFLAPNQTGMLGSSGALLVGLTATVAALVAASGLKSAYRTRGVSLHRWLSSTYPARTSRAPSRDHTRAPALTESRGVEPAELESLRNALADALRIASEQQREVLKQLVQEMDHSTRLLVRDQVGELRASIERLAALPVDAPSPATSNGSTSGSPTASSTDVPRATVSISPVQPSPAGRPSLSRWAVAPRGSAGKAPSPQPGRQSGRSFNRSFGPAPSGSPGPTAAGSLHLPRNPRPASGRLDERDPRSVSVPPPPPSVVRPQALSKFHRPGNDSLTGLLSAPTSTSTPFAGEGDTAPRAPRTNPPPSADDEAE